MYISQWDQIQNNEKSCLIIKENAYFVLQSYSTFDYREIILVVEPHSGAGN